MNRGSSDFHIYILYMYKKKSDSEGFIYKTGVTEHAEWDRVST